MSPWDDLKPLLLGPPAVTLSVAESLTCGHVQARIGSISGASTFFVGGVTAYSLEHKVRLLGVNAAEAAAVDCVSETIARQMARGACGLFGSDLALATTGYAEAPPPGRGDGPFAWWALAHRDASGEWRDRSGRMVASAGLGRGAVQQFVADEVLHQLRDYLRSWRRL